MWNKELMNGMKYPISNKECPRLKCLPGHCSGLDIGW